MTTSRSDSSVSRRAAVAGLGAGGLGLVMTGRGASAQDADMATHPIVGAWTLDFDPTNPGNTVRVIVGATGNPNKSSGRREGAVTTPPCSTSRT